MIQKSYTIFDFESFLHIICVSKFLKIVRSSNENNLKKEYLAASAPGSEMKTENSKSRKVAPTVPIFFLDVSSKRLSLFLKLGSSMYNKMPNG
jgi:hypothetical protein